MLYLITNRNIIKKDFFKVIDEAVESKVDYIILREKDLSDEELETYTNKINKILIGKDTKLIINNNLKIAYKNNAYGYHCSFKDFILESKPKNIVVGVSVHTIEEAIISEKKGADYVLASHIYETDCKKGLKPRGLEFIRDMRKKVKIPIIALGGINSKNIKEVMAAGVNGAAVMSNIMASENPYMSTKLLKKELES